MEELMGFCKNGGKLHVHPCKNAVPGIETSTGSLGHGLSVAAGMAVALRGSGQRMYVVIGDGECNEGTVWEAASFIGARKLSNVTVMIDVNHFQGFGTTEEIIPMDLAAQWAACGWEVLHVNGHDHAAIETALRQTSNTGKPIAILADTVAGKGIPEIENTLLAHYVVLNDAQYQQLMTTIYAE